MSDDNFDDGLVHGHHWATEKPIIHVPVTTVERVIEHDDGLVHGHAWASNADY